jgi:L-asparagine oxygenase
MISLKELDRSTLGRTLERDGFLLRSALAPQMSTLEIAQALGTVTSMELVLPSSGIPTVQSLRPRHTVEVGRNQYSGHYGVDTFPLHTKTHSRAANFCDVFILGD